MLSPDTFLPLPALRDELRVPAGVTEGDPRLQRHRAAAISWMEGFLGQPILDRTEAVFRACVPRRQDRVEGIRRPYVRRLTAIRYWETGGESEAPDGALTGGNLPRYVPLPDESGITVFAPAGGWPEMVEEAGIWIVMEVGLPESHRFADAVRDAGVAFVRNRWNGTRDVRPTDAFVSLLGAVRDYSDGGAHYFPDGWEGAVPDDGTGERLTYGGTGITIGGQRLRY